MGPLKEKWFVDFSRPILVGLKDPWSKSNNTEVSDQSL